MFSLQQCPHPEHPWLGHNHHPGHADKQGQRGLHPPHHGGKGGGNAQLLSENTRRTGPEVIQGNNNGHPRWLCPKKV